MARFQIKIQNEIFTTKSSLAERCKAILNSYEDGDKLTDEDL